MVANPVFLTSECAPCKFVNNTGTAMVVLKGQQNMQKVFENSRPYFRWTFVFSLLQKVGSWYLFLIPKLAAVAVLLHSVMSYDMSCHITR